LKKTSEFPSGLGRDREDKMTDDELFDEFFQQLRDRSIDELEVDVFVAEAPYTIKWGANEEYFLFKPAEARGQGLDVSVDEALARIRLWKELE
jgi:hypothetical protein